MKDNARHLVTQKSFWEFHHVVNNIVVWAGPRERVESSLAQPGHSRPKPSVSAVIIFDKNSFWESEMKAISQYMCCWSILFQSIFFPWIDVKYKIVPQVHSLYETPIAKIIVRLARIAWNMVHASWMRNFAKGTSYNKCTLANQMCWCNMATLLGRPN